MFEGSESPGMHLSYFPNKWLLIIMIKARSHVGSPILTELSDYVWYLFSRIISRIPADL